MKYNTRVLHSYGIQDGDELMVVPKTKWPADENVIDVMDYSFVWLTDDIYWETDIL